MHLQVTWENVFAQRWKRLKNVRQNATLNPARDEVKKNIKI